MQERVAQLRAAASKLPMVCTKYMRSALYKVRSRRAKTKFTPATINEDGALAIYSIAPFCPARGTPAASKKYNIAPVTSSCRDNVYCKYNI
mmetsp:Transcript_10763/g.17772  ORF Transcript_10763/g.17772 Transcript_10763/m.17772 type:complete len:91 (+) Transcript_10763:830-1102(+)